MLTGRGLAPWIIAAVVASGAISALPATGGQVEAGGACATWYVEYGGIGDGTTKKSPLGSLGDAEAASAECDTIRILSSAEALDDGIVLKDRQRLVGQAANPAADLDADPLTGDYALIANRAGTERNGHAVTCLGTCSIDRIWITEAFRSGVSAVDVDGDLTIKRSRVTDFNTSGEFSGPGPFPGTFNPFFAVRYRSDDDTAVTLRDSVIEGGAGTGLLVVSVGQGHVSSDVRSVVVRDLSSPSSDPVVFTDGMLFWAADDSDQDVTVRSSVVEDVQGPGFPGLGILIASAGTSGSEVTGDVRHNTLSGVDRGVWVLTTGDGPNQASAVISHNDVDAEGIGVLGVFSSDSAPQVDHLDIRHNSVAASGRGIEIIVGADDDPRAKDHRGDWVIAHNDVEIVGPTGGAFGIELSYESSTVSDSAVVEHNTVLGGPDVFESGGILVAGTAETGRSPSSDITVRHNDVRMGQTNFGMGFVSAAGIIGVPVVPEWDLRMRFEHNCVEDTQVGFAILDSIGFGFGTETFDLGGGELGSVGRNSFIGTDVDLGFLDFFASNTPSSPVVAENNFWDANNPIAADPLEAFVVDQVGTGQWDTEPFRSSGPTDCGLPPEG